MLLTWYVTLKKSKLYITLCILRYPLKIRKNQESSFAVLSHFYAFDMTPRCNRLTFTALQNKIRLQREDQVA